MTKGRWFKSSPRNHDEAPEAKSCRGLFHFDSRTAGGVNPAAIQVVFARPGRSGVGLSSYLNLYVIRPRVRS